ncbi:hypothetical protein ACWDXV_21950 [Nocardia nova]|uniref:hypothetical protein n=1 Tax=Nocardia nova TaxID=37330 RepID=UPI001CA55A25|nr:hypothetical protein [Nocardia nova]
MPGRRWSRVSPHRATPAAVGFRQHRRHGRRPSRLGSRRVVLYLYPLTGRPDTDLLVGWNTIPGARSRTAQACDFRNHHQDLRAAGAQRVYGLSSLRLAATLSAPTVEVDGTTLYKRMTLIVREQTIEHVFYPMFPTDQHVAEVLRWLQRNPD